MAEFVATVNGLVWSQALIYLCLAVGLHFSIRTRFMQVGSGHFRGRKRSSSVVIAKRKMSSEPDRTAHRYGLLFLGPARGPAPSSAEAGERQASLPASISAKVLLLNEVVASGMRPADLARRMGVTPQAVTRVLDLHHAS